MQALRFSTLIYETELVLRSRITQTPGARFLVMAIFALVLASCGRGDTVVIATAGNYHPFDFINDEGEVDGLERELGDELCSRADLECRWIVNDWNTMIPDLVAEEFDVILSGMSITAQREELLDFTEAYYPPTGSVYLALAGRGDSATEGTIGVGENTIYSDYLTKSGIPYIPVDHALEAVEMVLNGEVDSILVDHGYAVAKLAEHEGRLEIVGSPILIDRGLGIGVRQGSYLKGRLDEALSSMKADGTLNAIIVRWLGEDANTFE